MPLIIARMSHNVIAFRFVRVDSHKSECLAKVELSSNLQKFACKLPVLILFRFAARSLFAALLSLLMIPSDERSCIESLGQAGLLFHRNLAGTRAFSQLTSGVRSISSIHRACDDLSSKSPKDASLPPFGFPSTRNKILELESHCPSISGAISTGTPISLIASISFGEVLESTITRSNLLKGASSRRACLPNLV